MGKQTVCLQCEKVLTQEELDVIFDEANPKPCPHCGATHDCIKTKYVAKKGMSNARYNNIYVRQTLRERV